MIDSGLGLDNWKYLGRGRTRYREVLSCVWSDSRVLHWGCYWRHRLRVKCTVGHQSSGVCLNIIGVVEKKYINKQNCFTEIVLVIIQHYLKDRRGSKKKKKREELKEWQEPRDVVKPLVAGGRCTLKNFVLKRQIIKHGFLGKIITLERRWK